MTANETEGASPQDSTGEKTIILCDHCMGPVDPEEAVSEGIEDYHPGCPKEKMTEEEAQAALESKRSSVVVSGLSMKKPVKDFAAYPAENAGFPFVWFDIITADGEVSLALPSEDAAKWGKAIQRAAEECEEQ